MDERSWSAAYPSKRQAVERRRTPRVAMSLSRTAVPIAAVGLVNLGMGITDTAMMASLDPKALAAGAIIGDLTSLVVQFCAGALAAVAPPVSAAGARRADGTVGRTIGEGIRWAAILGIVGAAIIAAAPTGLQALGIKVPLPDVAATYAHYMAGTLVLMMMVALSRAVLPALGRGPVTFYVLAAAVPLNAVADAAFMYGWLGLPAMGLAGAGAASLAVAAAMAGALAAYLILAPGMRRFRIGRRLFVARLSRGLARAGALTGATALCETGVFLSSTVLVAFVAVEAVPAHVAVFRTVAVTYVLGTGFAQAVTIHVARAIALSRPSDEREIVGAAHLGILVLAPVFFAMLLFAPASIGSVMGVSGSSIGALAPWAAVAVCSMVPTVVAFGFLRARQDVLVPAVVSLVGYWGVGFSAMIVLSDPAAYGARGIWMGLAAGTITTAIGAWTYLKLKDRIARPILPVMPAAA